MAEARALPTDTTDLFPAGLESLYRRCHEIYPDQENPLQVTALLKYWLGGPDPLDYISMYANPGIPEKKIPPHWHYISFGLSDLHGDGRVHDINGPDGESGFGFELTFRLKRELEQTEPPTWPATLMNALAKYVFQSGNTLRATDHVTWHGALDNSVSRIQHMLMTNDPQLDTLHTPFGSVRFVQIVGICGEELKAAQQWNCAGVLDIISRMPTAGGLWHITDMRRGESIFELDPNAREEVERGFDASGSNLGGVSARCSWHEVDALWFERQHREESTNTPLQPIIEAIVPQSDRTAINTNLNESMAAEMDAAELLAPKNLWGIHLKFDLEAGNLLPLAIRGRVKHGRHFTFKSIFQASVITLVGSTVTGTLVNAEQPYVAQGPWLQVLITDEMAQDMAVRFQVLANPDELVLPKTFWWPDQRLAITITTNS